MAKKLKKIFTPGSDEVVQNFIVQSWHVSQSVDALTGDEDYDITISGSLTVTGSVYLDGIEDAGGSSIYNLVLNQSTGEVFTTASLSGGGGDDGTSGTSGATGDAGTSGTSGNDGANGALIFPYQYNTSGIGTPPSGDFYIKSGRIIFNNTDGTGTDLSNFYDTVNDYGDSSSGGVKAILKLEKVGDPTNFILYNVTDLPQNVSSRNTTVTTLVNPGYSFSNNDDILVSFNLVGVAGSDGTSGTGGSGTGGDGTSGTSGATGDAGTSGTSGGGGGGAGTSGTTGASGSSGTSGDGTSGTSGSGTSGTTGTAGTSGTGGAGTSGTSGAGTSGTSGSGTSGTSGTTGVAGTSGTSGAGTSGTSGSGTSGTTGAAGTSGTGGGGGSLTRMIYTRKEGESNSQNVSTGNSATIIWANQNDLTNNTEYFTLNANTYLSYDTIDYKYIKVETAGLYEISYQMIAIGTNADATAVVHVERYDTGLNTVQATISKKSFNAELSEKTNVLNHSQIYYISQDNIDTDQAYITIDCYTFGVGSSISFGGSSTNNTFVTWWSIKLIE